MRIFRQGCVFPLGFGVWLGMSEMEREAGVVLADLSSEFRERADRVFGSLPSCERRDQPGVEPAAQPAGAEGGPNQSRKSYVGEVKYKGRVHRVYFKDSRGRHGARYTPDYMKHPERWTKYDLKEDGTEKMKDMSADQVNKAAALQFLQDRRSSTACEDKHLIESNVTFQKPKNNKRVITTSTNASKVTGNVHVMPEYEVGKKNEHKKKVCSDQIPSCQSVKLSHLEDEEDESSE